MSNEPALKDLAVVNASPLIVLFKSGLEYVLPGLFGEIVVPEAVWSEATAYDDKACKAISTATWLKREKVESLDRILVWNLGRGETQVLSRVLGDDTCVAVLDDMAARKCSSALRIRYIGTAGILVIAARLGLVSSLENAFSAVRNAGLYLSDDLVKRLLTAERNEPDLKAE